MPTCRYSRGTAAPFRLGRGQLPLNSSPLLARPMHPNEISQPGRRRENLGQEYIGELSLASLGILNLPFDHNTLGIQLALLGHYTLSQLPIMIALELKSYVYEAPTGTQTHYLQTGTPGGPLLLCLHGLGGSTNTFLPLLPYLPKTYNINFVDFQGFGQSPLSTEGPFSVAGHVADLHHLITSLQAADDSTAGVQKVSS